MGGGGGGGESSIPGKERARAVGARAEEDSLHQRLISR